MFLTTLKSYGSSLPSVGPAFVFLLGVVGRRPPPGEPTPEVGVPGRLDSRRAELRGVSGTLASSSSSSRSVFKEELMIKCFTTGT